MHDNVCYVKSEEVLGELNATHHLDRPREVLRKERPPRMTEGLNEHVRAR